MRRYLLDTNAASDYINRRFGVRERAVAEVLRGNRVGTCIPVLGELWFGVENSSNQERNRQRLMLAVADWRVWPYEADAAEVYGRLAAHLKRTGRVVGQVDIMVAAIALTLGSCTVVTTDRDYLAIPDLATESWRTEAEEATP